MKFDVMKYLEFIISEEYGKKMIIGDDRVQYHELFKQVIFVPLKYDTGETFLLKYFYDGLMQFKVRYYRFYTENKTVDFYIVANGNDISILNVCITSSDGKTYIRPSDEFRSITSSPYKCSYFDIESCNLFDDDIILYEDFKNNGILADVESNYHIECEDVNNALDLHNYIIKEYKELKQPKTRKNNN